MCPRHPPRSPTSALGRGLPSLVGCISFIHSWVCSLPLHSMVSQSISSAPGLHWGQGSSDRPSLISGHSHEGVIALGHRGDIEEVSTESYQGDWVGAYESVSLITQSRLTLCNPMNRSTTGLPVHHQLPESTQTHVHQVNDVI